MAIKTTYHRDRTVTIWDVYTQGWVRTDRPRDEVLASLDSKERERVIRHCRISQTMTFLEFWNANDVSRVWIVTTAAPTGIDLIHDEDDHDFFDLGEWFDENKWIHDLTGKVVDGQWRWDGEQKVNYLTSSVLNVVAD